jgi:hypothetical protein
MSSGRLQATQHSALSAQCKTLGSLLGTLALLALAWPRPGGAQEAGWEREGLSGREVRALALAPDSSGMLALTGGARDPSPLWVRDAQDWSQPVGEAPGFILALAPLPEGGVMLGTGRDISDQPGVFLLAGSPPRVRRMYEAQAIGALAVAPGRGASDVYAAAAPWADRDADSDLLRWDAAGGSWSTILHGTLACDRGPSYFRQIAVAPSSPSTLFALEWCFASAARQAQLWRSDDRGQSWQVLPRPGGAQALISALAVDPTDPDVLYLAGPSQPGSPPAGLERSLDGGRTWSLKGDAIDGPTAIRTLLVDPRHPRRVLAGSEQGGVFSSEDRGETWYALTGLESVRVRSLAVDETVGRLYAATSDGIWRLPLS